MKMTGYRLLTVIHSTIRPGIRLIFTGPAKLAGLMFFVPMAYLLITGTAETSLETWLQQEATAWRSAPEGHIMQERCLPSVTMSPVPEALCEQVPVPLHEYARTHTEHVICLWVLLCAITLAYECLLWCATYNSRTIRLRSALFRYKDE